MGQLCLESGGEGRKSEDGWEKLQECIGGGDLLVLAKKSLKVCPFRLGRGRISGGWRKIDGLIIIIIISLRAEFRGAT